MAKTFIKQIVIQSVMRLYTPQEYPTEAAILIACIAFVGILGGFLIHHFFMLFALIFWMQYTAVLSYRQFAKKSKHEIDSFTGLLLNPQIRFFLFEMLAVMGIMAIIKYQNLNIGGVVLGFWFAFALNFYFHYKKKHVKRKKRSKK